MNNKGFMMAEVIVVSAIVLVFLTGLYLSYDRLFSIYNARINYYDTTTLYRLAYYRDVLIQQDKMNNTLNNAKNSPVNIIGGLSNNVSRLSDGDSAFRVYNVHKKINSGILPNSINATFKDYVDYLSASIEFKSNYILVMERCIDKDDCKYAYLEVYDGKET